MKHFVIEEQTHCNFISSKHTIPGSDEAIFCCRMRQHFDVIDGDVIDGETRS